MTDVKASAGPRVRLSGDPLERQAQLQEQYEERPTFRYRLLDGMHVEEEPSGVQHVYGRGDVFDSKHAGLAGRDPGKFADASAEAAALTPKERESRRAAGVHTAEGPHTLSPAEQAALAAAAKQRAEELAQLKAESARRAAAAAHPVVPAPPHPPA